MGVVHKRKNGEQAIWNWDGVDVHHYETGNPGDDVPTKQVLIGAEDGAPNFVLRYFTIPPRGKSSLDHHEHDHGVVITHGRARVMLGDEYEEVSEGDVVYIPGWERHQFENLTDEPFTFLCIIPPKSAQPDMCAVPNTAEVDDTAEVEN